MKTRPFVHYHPLITPRKPCTPLRHLVVTSTAGGVANTHPLDGETDDNNSTPSNPILQPVLQASRSFNHAQRQVSRSLSDLEHRLGTLLTAPPECATQEGNEWMLDTREYEFSRKQESVFRTLEKSMHACSNVLLLLAATDVIMGYIGYQREAELLDLYASLADAFHELVTAVMVRYGSKSFRAVFETRGHDIRNLMGGLVNLSNVILEVAVISSWLAASVLATFLRIATWGRPAYAQALTATVLHTAESLKASVQWVFHLGGLLRRNVGQPMRRAKRRINKRLGKATTQLSSTEDDSVMAGMAMERMSSTGTPADSQEWSNAQSNTQSNAQSNTPTTSRRPMVGTLRTTTISMPNNTRRAQYEFSKDQEQVFRGVLAALRICSLAKWAQGLSEMVLVVSHIATRQWSQAVAGAFDTLDALVVAGLLMVCMRSFDQIIRTSGHDISLLLDALGPQHGIAKLFSEFADVALFLALAQIGQVSSGVALPGSVEASVGLVAVGLGIIQQLM